MKIQSAGTLRSIRYTYDALGNITRIQESVTGDTQVFGYDALNRLTSASASGGNYGAYGPESYTYDPVSGNLATKAGVTLSYAATDHAHAVSSTTETIGTDTRSWAFTYDANGNQVERRYSVNSVTEVFTLGYDAENRLAEVRKNGQPAGQVVYDGDGQRVKAVFGAETSLYPGSLYEQAGGDGLLQMWVEGSGLAAGFETRFHQPVDLGRKVCNGW